MSKNLLIGDCHFGHNGISEKFRTQFNSDEEHDNVIYQEILNASGKRNQLYMLGDIFFKQSTFWRLEEMSNRYQTVHIVLGNHDHKQFPEYAMQFGNVYLHGIIKKWGFWLSHAPIHPQELYRGFNLHGHVHTNTVPDPRYFNCSCENIGYKPVDLQSVKEIFEQRKSDGLIVEQSKHKD